MAEDQTVGTWPKIIESVTSIMGLSALAVLAAGTAFTAVLVKTPQEEQFRTFIVMGALLLVIILANMIYEYFVQRYELTFRVHVARAQDGMETPVEVPVIGAQVDLYKNGKNIRSVPTDEMGLMTFSEKLKRNDELYVVVEEPVTKKRSNKAILYSPGQSSMTKRIRL